MKVPYFISLIILSCFTSYVKSKLHYGGDHGETSTTSTTEITTTTSPSSTTEITTTTSTSSTTETTTTTTPSSTTETTETSPSSTTETTTTSPSSTTENTTTTCTTTTTGTTTANTPSTTRTTTTSTSSTTGITTANTTSTTGTIIFASSSINDTGSKPISKCDGAVEDESQQSCWMVKRWVRDLEELVKKGCINPETPSASPDSDIKSSDGQTLLLSTLELQSTQSNAPPLSNVKNMYDCTDIGCVCKGFGGTASSDGKTCTVNKNGNQVNFGRAVRQECRTLSSNQLQNLFRSFHSTKWGNNQNTYNNWVYSHQAPRAPIAHGSPMFCLWHREFCKRVEISLRHVDPSVGLCYWDSSLDNELDDPRDSCLWTADLFGEIENGRITSGTFSNWTTINGTYLTRRLSQMRLISRDMVQRIPNYDMNSILAFTGDWVGCTDEDGTDAKNEQLEYIHGRTHNFVGGEMRDIWTSPNDPCFFFHHSYIDYLYELWRAQQKRQGQNPEKLYPEDFIVKNNCAHRNNSLKSPMQPFMALNNEVGLSNSYTDNMYTYLPSPICSKSQSCGSPYLFCCYNPGPVRCVAKIKIGGNCQKFSQSPSSDQTSLFAEDVNPCYKGRCVNGKCQQNSNSVQLIESAVDNSINFAGVYPPRLDILPIKPIKLPPLLPDLSPILAKIIPFRHCYDNHYCCQQWSKDGYCDSQRDSMNVWCPATCSCDGCLLTRLQRSLFECTDLFPLCKIWLLLNPKECDANPLWMACNCAGSCGKCATDRASYCSGGPLAKGYIVNSAQIKEINN